MENYDPTKPLKYMLYLDMNNLYGWAMSGDHLYGGSKWLENIDISDVNVIIECNSIENSSTRCILKVDFEYPVELHALHKDYPLAPENFEIPYDMLLDYCKKIADEYGIKNGDVMK